MLVKFEPLDSVDLPDELDIESKLFREQLFGNSTLNSDFSESGSDEDILSRFVVSSDNVEFDSASNQFEISVHTDSSRSGSVSSSDGSHSPPESLSAEMDISTPYIQKLDNFDEAELHISICSPSEHNNDIKTELVSPCSFNIQQSNSFWDVMHLADVKPRLENLAAPPTSDPESFLNHVAGSSSPQKSFTVSETQSPIPPYSILPTISSQRFSVSPNLLLPATLASSGRCSKTPVKVAPKLPCSTIYPKTENFAESVHKSSPHPYSPDGKQPYSTVLVHSNPRYIDVNHINPTYTDVNHNSVRNIGEITRNLTCQNIGRKQISESELHAMKRRERMIKNRESALLSRKKKKDYVSGLEKRVKELNEENTKLKNENARLLHRIQCLEGEFSVRKKPNFHHRKASIVLLSVFGCFVFNFFGSNVFTEVNHDPRVFTQDESASTFHFKSRSLLSLGVPARKNISLSSSVNHSHFCPHSINTSQTRVINENLRHAFNNSVKFTVSDDDMFDIRNSIDTNSFLLSMKNGLLRNKNGFKQRKSIDPPAFEKGGSRSKFLSLFHSFKNRNDTNYLFFDDHRRFFLADEQNETCGPKLSIFVSTTGSGFDEDSTLMQIDCLVTHTELRSLRSSKSKKSKSKSQGQKIPKRSRPVSR